MIIKHTLHELWVIEYSIVSSLIYLDLHSLNFILPLQQNTLQDLEAFYITWKQQIPRLGP